MKREKLVERVLQCNESDFEDIAYDVYDYQFHQNSLYHRFVTTLKSANFKPSSIQEIPSLPISFFKSHTIKSGSWESVKIYKSSATTGMIRSQHHLRDHAFYLKNAENGFTQLYGTLEKFAVFALLPGYIERGDSSLVGMCQHFISQSSYAGSGFFLHDHKALLEEIERARSAKKLILLIGVSYAILQLCEQQVDLSDIIVMETGGMKGKGPELPKPAFHQMLNASFGTKDIHSEYGMTELLSQAYSKGNQLFLCSSTMRVFTTEITDPLTIQKKGKAGVMHIVDLANLDSCAFIRTEDLGIQRGEMTFEILGRLDAAEIRGCNLLVSDL